MNELVLFLEYFQKFKVLVKVLLFFDIYPLKSFLATFLE
jgi:hypothetical protein